MSDRGKGECKPMQLKEDVPLELCFRGSDSAHQSNAIECWELQVICASLARWNSRLDLCALDSSDHVLVTHRTCHAVDEGLPGERLEA